ncbi:MAG: XRE family transcriptional regulator [Candidatus Riflebacteria bacterium]|nr:XRE family transcriptional regulator [Candidatus Riflebacteria bacterium]
MGFGKRLKALMAEKKISQDVIALHCGVSQAAVSKWCREESEPNIETIHKIAEILKIDFLELATAGAESRRLAIKTLKIPIYEAEASAGHGCFNDTEAVENYLMIDRETFRGELQCDPDNLAIIRVRGDSMKPVIKPGEMVVIDKTVNTFVTDGIYVIRLDLDVIVVKRIQILLGRRINVISANADYPPYQIDLADSEGLAVIGRVMAIISMEKVGV